VEAMAVASALNTLSVVVGVLINNSTIRELRDHMDTRFDEMRDFWVSEPLRWPST
jgi:hypothetical protein